MIRRRKTACGVGVDEAEGLRGGVSWGCLVGSDDVAWGHEGAVTTPSGPHSTHHDSTVTRAADGPFGWVRRPLIDV